MRFTAPNEVAASQFVRRANDAAGEPIASIKSDGSVLVDLPALEADASAEQQSFDAAVRGLLLQLAGKLGLVEAVG